MRTTSKCIEPSMGSSSRANGTCGCPPWNVWPQGSESQSGQFFGKQRDPNSRQPPGTRLTKNAASAIVTDRSRSYCGRDLPHRFPKSHTSAQNAERSRQLVVAWRLILRTISHQTVPGNVRHKCPRAHCSALATPRPSTSEFEMHAADGSTAGVGHLSLPVRDAYL